MLIHTALLFGLNETSVESRNVTTKTLIDTMPIVEQDWDMQEI